MDNNKSSQLLQKPLTPQVLQMPNTPQGLQDIKPPIEPQLTVTPQNTQSRPTPQINPIPQKPQVTQPSPKPQVSPVLQANPTPQVNPTIQKFQSQPLNQGIVQPKSNPTVQKVQAQPLSQGIVQPKVSPTVQKVQAQPLNQGIVQPKANPTVQKVQTQPLSQGIVQPKANPTVQKVQTQPLSQGMVQPKVNPSINADSHQLKQPLIKNSTIEQSKSINSTAPNIITPTINNQVNKVQDVKADTKGMEENVDTIKKSLYIPVLTSDIEELIIAYVDAYHSTLDYCLKTAVPDDAKLKELELLSGPINEIYNPNNQRMFDGNTYPVVDLILNKINEYAEGLEKGFTRSLKPPQNAAPLTEETPAPEFNTFGYLSVLLIFIFVVVFSVGLGYVLFLLKK